MNFLSEKTRPSTMSVLSRLRRVIKDKEMYLQSNSDRFPMRFQVLDLLGSKRRRKDEKDQRREIEKIKKEEKPENNV